MLNDGAQVTKAQQEKEAEKKNRKHHARRQKIGAAGHEGNQKDSETRGGDPFHAPFGRQTHGVVFEQGKKSRAADEGGEQDRIGINDKENQQRERDHPREDALFNDVPPPGGSRQYTPACRSIRSVSDACCIP